MPVDDGCRVECRPRVGITAEQSRDGLALGARVGSDIAGDVLECAEFIRVHHRKIDGAGSAHRPACDGPFRPIRADAEVRLHVRNNVLDHVVGRVTACSVDAFGVVVERTTGVDEDQHRGVAVMGGGEVVDRLDGLTGAQPVGGSVELAADHHQCRELGWRGAGIPGRREVDELAAVPEARRCIACVDRHHRAFRRHLVQLLQGGDGHLIGLVRQRACGQLVPCGLHGLEVADPHIQRQPGAHHAEGDRREGDTTPPPLGAAPSDHQYRRSETGQPDPDPQRARGRIVGEPLRCDIPVGRRGQCGADDQCPRQPAHLPAAAAPADRSDQHDGRDDLHGCREPAMD